MITIDQVISQIESSNYEGAMRFEPGFYRNSNPSINLITHIANLNLCDSETAKVIQATSWGLYQIMGYNIYDITSPAKDYKILYFLNSSILQLEAFNWFLQKNTIDYTMQEMFNDHTMLDRFALKYNGAIGYADKIMETYKMLQLVNQKS